MPYAPKKPCIEPGCKSFAERGAYCLAHAKHKDQRADERRGSAASRGYNSRWRKARETWLRRHPLCVRCQATGDVTAATVVDHIVPHKGDSALFWNTGNWQSLCKPCHDAKTATEDGGFGR